MLTKGHPTMWKTRLPRAARAGRDPARGNTQTAKQAADPRLAVEQRRSVGVRGALERRPSAARCLAHDVMEYMLQKNEPQAGLQPSTANLSLCFVCWQRERLAV